MALLGLDIGTTGSRAVLVDGERAPAGHGDRSPTTRSPHRRRDGPSRTRTIGGVPRGTPFGVCCPPTLAASCRGAGRRAVRSDARSGAARPHAGVVVRPAIIWCDQRTDDQCRWLTTHVGATRLVELVSNPALTGFTLPKLLWVRQHEPNVWDACPHPAVAQGLRSAAAHRRARHRCRRCVGHPDVRCRTPSLVVRAAGPDRNRTRMAARRP